MKATKLVSFYGTANAASAALVMVGVQNSGCTDAVACENVKSEAELQACVAATPANCEFDVFYSLQFTKAENSCVLTLPVVQPLISLEEVPVGFKLRSMKWDGLDSCDAVTGEMFGNEPGSLIMCPKGGEMGPPAYATMSGGALILDFNGVVRDETKGSFLVTVNCPVPFYGVPIAQSLRVEQTFRGLASEAESTSMTHESYNSAASLTREIEVLKSFAMLILHYALF